MNKLNIQILTSLKILKSLNLFTNIESTSKLSKLKKSNKASISFSKSKKSSSSNVISKSNKSTGLVKSAIEGVVFIHLKEDSIIFIGELIEFVVTKAKKKIKGMVIGLSVGTAEIMLFGDTSEIAPGDL